MKNYLVNELVTEIYEGRLELIDRDTIDLLEKIDMYTTLIDIKYENRLRDKQLTDAIESYNDDIKNLIDRINTVELALIKDKKEKLMFECETRKGHLINIMMYLQEKYL